jgi:hypothetical protein
MRRRTRCARADADPRRPSGSGRIRRSSRLPTVNRPKPPRPPMRTRLRRKRSRDDPGVRRPATPRGPRRPGPPRPPNRQLPNRQLPNRHPRPRRRSSRHRRNRWRTSWCNVRPRPRRRRRSRSRRCRSIRDNSRRSSVRPACNGSRRLRLLRASSPSRSHRRRARRGAAGQGRRPPTSRWCRWRRSRHATDPAAGGATQGQRQTPVCRCFSGCRIQAPRITPQAMRGPELPAGCDR